MHRESARTAPRRIGTAAARQPLKLKRYKSDVGGLRPLRGRPFAAWPDRGRRRSIGAAPTCDGVPAPEGCCVVDPRKQGPPRSASPHQKAVERDAVDLSLSFR